MRLYMKLRQTHSTAVAAAKASINLATGYCIEQDPRLPSQKKAPRGRRRPDPLADIFDGEVVPLLKAAPGIRPVAIFEEMMRHTQRSLLLALPDALSSGLRHLFFSKEWLRDIADELGFVCHEVRARIANSAQNAYRFHVRLVRPYITLCRANDL
jgi:hypothetical protein